MSDSVHLACPHCHTTNRIPQPRAGDGPRCGKCKGALFTGLPIELSESEGRKHLAANDLPILIDFWAPWCGPCRTLTPILRLLAGEFEPRLQLIKINTDAAKSLAGEFNIRSIPTLILFHKGQEISRQSGALPAHQLRHWIETSIR